MNLDWNVILPLAHRWSGSKEKEILAAGDPLSIDLIEFALKIGIKHPEKVRVLLVDKIPTPAHPLLERAGQAIGFIPKNIAAMALGYGIFLRKDCACEKRIYQHELVHVRQYEELGGIKPFLNRYINEVLTHGYPNAPMEKEARMLG